jgi:hypothetical protein
MPMTTLTAHSTIATWLADPTGGPLLRGFFAQTGQDEASLKPVLGFALQRLRRLRV